MNLTGQSSVIYPALLWDSDKATLVDTGILGHLLISAYSAVCTVIEPPLQLVMLLTEKTTWVNTSVPVALRFNCAANRCTACCGESGR